MGGYSRINLKGKDLVSINDWSNTEIIQLLDDTEDMLILESLLKSDDPKALEHPSYHALQDKICACLFFEDSTRTRESTHTAVFRLGGNTIGFHNAEKAVIPEDGSDNVVVKGTSTAKGESFSHTIRMYDHYADIIAIRHPVAGSVYRASQVASVPIINCGDGANQHPTQTLLDLFTIRKHCRGLTNLRVGMVGDLKNGRTVHSLGYALMSYQPEYFFASPDFLRMPQNHLREYEEHGIVFHEYGSLEEVVRNVDVLYMTRLQIERARTPEEVRLYQSCGGKFILTPEIVSTGKDSLIIMHPLPIVDEIVPAVEKMPQAIYFHQASYGVPVRMSVLKNLLGK